MPHCKPAVKGPASTTCYADPGDGGVVLYRHPPPYQADLHSPLPRTAHCSATDTVFDSYYAAFSLTRFKLLPNCSPKLPSTIPRHHSVIIFRLPQVFHYSQSPLPRGRGPVADVQSKPAFHQSDSERLFECKWQQRCDTSAPYASRETLHLGETPRNIGRPIPAPIPSGSRSLLQCFKQSELFCRRKSWAV